MKNIRRASVKQLANKIKGFTNYPRFACFLGPVPPGNPELLLPAK